MTNPFKVFRQAVSDIFLDNHLQAICLWKVFFPLFLILIIYPVYAFFLKVDHPFQRAFAHGDLLIFSALVMVEAAVELKEVRSRYDELLRFVAMSAIVIFGFVKYGAMLRESNLHHGDVSGLAPEAAAAAVRAAHEAAVDLHAFSFFNCAVAACAVIISLYSFLHAVRKKNRSGVEALEQDQS
jgi:hypothetical protein